MDDNGVSVSMLFPVMKTMAKAGRDWAEFCAYANIDASLFRNAEARIGQGEFEKVIKAAAGYTGNELFGLHQGLSMSISDLGVLGYVMLHSEKLANALAAYRKYNFIVCSGFNADLKIQGKDAVISLFIGNSEGLPNRHCIEDMTVSFYQIMLGLCCRPLPIQAVHFMHAPPSARVEEYSDIFGVAPTFNQESNALVFRKEALDYAVVGSDERLFGVFKALAEEVRGRLTRGSDLANKLSRWILESMPSRFPTLREAARELLMSARTLQSRLKTENTSYNRLANEVRKELAIRYLAQPEYSVGEIAYLLHFSEPSAFQTAFRKWTDATPREYRQRVLT
ncbi:AraC family transcriptional regulator [Cohnella lupini]|uniref:AraC family transcriptional regulator n=1 Tax=Cohnella lupini TaxID=1294267 RepID=A0A3D9I1C1_9BACL|nr:AraC family transcriptional regulator [Cohnella lupini]RED55543.1 AraC family transcriptional regulator [Cohnella lupini]